MTDTLFEYDHLLMHSEYRTPDNKRASVIFANHYMISQGAGMVIIPEKEVPEFKRLLVAY